MLTTIKRPFKRKGLSKDNLFAFKDLIENTNLFAHNIYLFISSYYIFKLSSYKLNAADILIIFKILRDGKDYYDTTCDFYGFYAETYEQIYFNPKKTNNITMNFDKYLNRFITCFMRITCKDTFEYNNLIKKCSSYECYKQTKVIEGLVSLLKVLTIRNDEFIKYYRQRS